MDEPKPFKVYVRKLSDRSIVHTVEVKAATHRRLERVVSGLLRNMDTDRYFVDDSEGDHLLEASDA
jgi:hypothetical protein